MGASTENVSRGSQATPLAQDVIKMLQGQLSQGAGGQGLGPMQRQAGTAISQFVNAAGQRPDVNTAAMVGDETQGLIQAITGLSNLNTNRGAADLREGFGAGGARFGSSAALGEADLRGRAQAELNPVIAQTLMGQAQREQGAREFDVGANANMDNQFMSAIAQLFGQGQQNQAPIFDMASLGILPEEVIQTPSVAGQLGGGLMQGIGAFLGGPGGGNLFEKLFSSKPPIPGDPFVPTPQAPDFP